MGIKGVDHINLRVVDVMATLKFYTDALGLKATGMIEPEPSAQGGWLRDDNGMPVIHVGALSSRYPDDDGTPVVARTGSGAIHHVALDCSEMAVFIERFRQMDIGWRENAIPEIPLAQLFVRDPNGVLLELNFLGETGGAAARS